MKFGMIRMIRTEPVQKDPIIVYGRGNASQVIGRFVYSDTNLNGHEPGYFFEHAGTADFSASTLIQIGFELRRLNRHK